MAKDVSAFLDLDGRAEAREPPRAPASATLIFLIFATVLAYMAYQNIWHGGEAAGCAPPARSIRRTWRSATASASRDRGAVIPHGWTAACGSVVDGARDDPDQ